MSEWIPVDKRLPPNDTMVLVIVYDHREAVHMDSLYLAVRYNNMWVDPKDYEKIEGKKCVVTHWMVLPDVPLEIEKAHEALRIEGLKRRAERTAFKKLI